MDSNLQSVPNNIPLPKRRIKILLFSLFGFAILTIFLVHSLNQQNQTQQNTIAQITAELNSLKQQSVTPTPADVMNQEFLSNIRKLRVMNASPDSASNSTALFDIDIPDGWNLTRYESKFPYVLTLQKGSYNITIFQPIEGGFCEFDDSYRFGDGPTNFYASFETIPASFDPGLRFVQVNRYQEEETLTPILSLKSCMKFNNPQYSLPYYVITTPVGVINLNLPEEYDTVTFNEIKTILKNIRLIPRETK